MPWTIDNPPSAIKNKSKAGIEAGVKAGNAALERGLSEQDAIFAAIAACANYEKKHIQASIAKKAKVNVPLHIKLIKEAAKQRSEVALVKTETQPEQKQLTKIHQAFLGKNALTTDKQRNIVSADFDQEGRLVLMFDTGEKITTNPAPSEQVTVNRTVVVQQMIDALANAGENGLYTRRIDFINDNLFYKGEALPGSSESALSWRISLVQLSLDGDLSETWANGTSDFNKAWSDRLTYIYN
jgi:uncharacterized protein YdaT